MMMMIWLWEINIIVELVREQNLIEYLLYLMYRSKSIDQTNNYLLEDYEIKSLNPSQQQ